MKRLMNVFVKNLHFVIYAVFLFLQMLGHRYLVLFGDDYYYANFIPQGWDYFVSENIFHYTDTNGRAFVHIIDELLLGFDFNIWKIFNILTIALIVLFAAKIAAKTYEKGYDTKEFKIALSASSVLFAAISREVYVNCVYWATGAVNYLFPVLLVLVYYYYAKKDLELDKGYFWLPILAFFASFTVEQSAAASFAVSIYLVLLCALKYRRKIRIPYFVSLAASGIALVSVVFAPGNSVRMTYYPEFYAKSFFGKIFEGIIWFMMQLFCKSGPILLFVILAVYSVVRIYNRAKSKKKKACAIVLFALTAFYIACAYAPISNWQVVLCAFLAFILLSVFFVMKLKDLCALKDDESAFFFVLAAGLQAVMLISPEFGWRTLLISIILLFVPALRAIIWGAGQIKANRKPIVSVICVFAVVSAFSNLILIREGYKENYPVHEYNEMMMEKYTSGEIDGVKLAYPINDEYRYVMPYDNSYHMYRYVQMWGLSDDTVVEFEKYPW